MMSLKRITAPAKYTLAVAGALFLMSGTSLAGWHELSQADRNNRIVSQAYAETTIPPTYGGQCKVWADHTVNVAAAAAGTPNLHLPRTLPTADGWYWDSGSVYSYGQLHPSLWVPGMIVQMRIASAGGGYGPHTAIVVLNNPGTQTVYWVDSNYRGDGRVYMRSETYGHFLGSVEPTSHFTVYVVQ